MNEAVKPYAERLTEMKNKRLAHEAEWRDISDFLLSRRGLFNGEKRESAATRKSKALDTKPLKALRNLAAMMQGGLTSPARPWFQMRHPDPDLNEFGPVRAWLDYVERILYQAYSKSNFYASIHSIYTELAGFGTACLYVEEDWKKYIRCEPLTIGTYWMALDGQSRTDTVYRAIWMTARQIKQRFGVTPEKVRAALDANKPLEEFEVIHAVFPREKRDPDKVDAENMAYESVYFMNGGDYDLLRKGGYEDCPFMVPRWDVVSGDVYGFGPGADVLADLKQLTLVSKDVVRAIHQQLDPPLLVPGGFKDRISMAPGALNEYQGPTGSDAVKPLFQHQARVDHSLLIKNDLRDAIETGFFNDLFIFMMSRPNVTATEIVERQEEKLLLLGPVIERQQAELLDPLTDRVFGILMRKGLFPPPPRELQGQELKVEYISLLAQAQKMVGTQAVQSAISFAAGAAQLDPQVLDKVDLDEAVDVYGELVGVPNRVIRSDDAVKKLRQQRAMQQQAQQQQEAALASVQAAKDLSGIPADGNNVLSQMMGGGQGGPVQ